MVTNRQSAVRAASLGCVRRCYIIEAPLVQFGRHVSLPLPCQQPLLQSLR
jgi:hypothetical protein